MKANALTKVIDSPQYGGHYKEMSFTFGTWAIEEVRGIQNYGSNEKSALWVLDWIAQEQNFRNEVIAPVTFST